MREYLQERNGHLPRSEWPVTCICFAPYAPEQNPIEEVWRQGKAAIQRLRLTAETFAEVIATFEQQLERKLFTFAKRLMYGQLQAR
jgi:transposase